MDYEERIAARKRSVNFGIYLPQTLVEVIDRIADSEAVAPNTVFVRLLRKGMAIERGEREAAAKGE